VTARCDNIFVRHRNAPALTLIEVILAIALSAIVLGGAMAFYRHTLMARRTIEEQVRTTEATRRAMDLMTNELRTALAYPSLGIGIEGQWDRIQFVATSLPGPEAWDLSEREKVPIEPSYDLRLVGYGLQVIKDEQTGELVTEGLTRTMQKVLTTKVAEEGTDVTSVLLSPYVKFVSFRYWQDGEWLDSWGGGDLPRAVEIVMGFQPLPEGVEVKDYPGRTLKRVVYLPGAGGGGTPSGKPGSDGLPAGDGMGSEGRP